MALLVETGRLRFDRWVAPFVPHKEIIRQGYGHAYTKRSLNPTTMAELRASEKKAREEKQGLSAPLEPRVNESSDSWRRALLAGEQKCIESGDALLYVSYLWTHGSFT